MIRGDMICTFVEWDRGRGNASPRIPRIPPRSRVMAECTSLHVDQLAKGFRRQLAALPRLKMIVQGTHQVSSKEYMMQSSHVEPNKGGGRRVTCQPGVSGDGSPFDVESGTVTVHLSRSESEQCLRHDMHRTRTRRQTSWQGEREKICTRSTSTTYAHDSLHRYRGRHSSSCSKMSARNNQGATFCKRVGPSALLAVVKVIFMDRVAILGKFGRSRLCTPHVDSFGTAFRIIRPFFLSLFGSGAQRLIDSHDGALSTVYRSLQHQFPLTSQQLCMFQEYVTSRHDTSLPHYSTAGQRGIRDFPSFPGGRTLTKLSMSWWLL